MITIKNKKRCCGCGACAQKCPKQCIKMVEDKEGFLYPQVDEKLCVACGLCEKTCPMLASNSPKKALAIYASINTIEEERMNSSSGGVFIALAKKVLNENGVVFGAVYDESWEVYHTYTEKIEGVYAMMGSKYLQSRVEKSFKDAETFLKQGRMVLFVGSPCQINGLNSFLKRKEYPNLLAVDFLCHGVPSPGVWRSYLYETYTVKQPIRRKAEAGKNTVLLSSLNAKSPIGDIKFRDKNESGWKKYRFVILKKSASKADQNSVLSSCIHSADSYMHLFLTDVILRPSCYDCQSKNGRNHSDLTIGDFWGAKDYVANYDDKGISLVLCHTVKGKEIFKSLDLKNESVTFEQAVLHNGGFKEKLAVPSIRKSFFHAFGETKEFYQSKKACEKIALRTRIKKKLNPFLQMFKRIK